MMNDLTYQLTDMQMHVISRSIRHLLDTASPITDFEMAAISQLSDMFNQSVVTAHA